MLYLRTAKSFANTQFGAITKEDEMGMRIILILAMLLLQPVAMAQELFQLHNDGWIWRYTNVACNGNSCPGWERLDNNSNTKTIATSGEQLVQLHKDGNIWRFTGAPCNGNSCPGWQRLDNNPKTVAIAASGTHIYQLHNDGWIWRYTNVPCNGNSCPGWQRLDNNAKTKAIVAAGDKLYQLHKDGWIWRFTGTPCNGNSCPGWQRLDNNAKTVALAASNTNLYQLHKDGWIWRYTGTACNGNSCPGWQRLDNNPKTVALAATDTQLYQLHKDGWIWRHTGTPCKGNSCPGWQRLDNNPKTKAISAAGTNLYQLHNDGWIWRYTGTACTGNSCPGWQRLDNNSKTTLLASSSGGLQTTVCTPPALENLAVTLRPQQTNMWCWAASGQMTMEYLGRSVSQCVQANNRFGRSDCCTSPTPNACVEGGWPEYDKYNFSFTRTSNTALSWNQVRQELADSPQCGRRAFAFSWHWPGGGGHMMVAIGYKTEDNVNYVEVNDPWSPDVGDHRFMTYDFYVTAAGDHTHWDDFHNLVNRGGL